jgi:hypothetical protein
VLAKIEPPNTPFGWPGVDDAVGAEDRARVEPAREQLGCGRQRRQRRRIGTDRAVDDDVVRREVVPRRRARGEEHEQETHRARPAAALVPALAPRFVVVKHLQCLTEVALSRAHRSRKPAS